MNTLERWHRYNKLVECCPELKDLRDWVEKEKWGFGDRPLYWMWYLLLKNVDINATLCEIGVYKGQTLALWRTISNMLNKNFLIVGISPLVGTTDKYHRYEDTDYLLAIERIHNAFELDMPILIKGRSQDVSDKIDNIDVLYIDGSHDYEDVKRDFELYVPKTNHYVVVDDASCKIQMETDSSMWYKGLEDVSRACDEWYLNQDEFKQVSVVGHNRIFQRVKGR